MGHYATTVPLPPGAWPILGAHSLLSNPPAFFSSYFTLHTHHTHTGTSLGEPRTWLFCFGQGEAGGRGFIATDKYRTLFGKGDVTDTCRVATSRRRAAFAVERRGGVG